MWHIDTVATSHLQDVISWTKNHFTQKFGTDKEINWLRIKDDTIIRQSTRTTKDNWLWAVS